MINRDTHIKPTLPTLGAAGSNYVDSVFGTTIIRVTDDSTPAGGDDDTGRSFRTPASTETRGWSCDGASFFLMSTFGTAEAFNATTRARIGTLAFQNEPTFSSATANLLWGPDTTEHPQICSITTAGTKTVGLDLTDLVPSLLSGPRTYLGQLLTAGDPERLAVNFGGTSQDLHYLCLVADVSDLAGGRILDTLASTIDGVSIGTTLGFYLHSIGLDQTGRYVLLYPVGQVPPIVVWDTQTDTFTTLTFADDAPGGHGALGYGKYANQDATGTYDGLQYQLRSLATPHISTDLQSPLLLPVEVYLGTHPNWNNAKGDSAEPIIVGTYREAAGLDQDTYPWRAWDDEIISMATDGSFVIHRYCHHRSDLSIISDNWGVFWYTPRPQVSPDGSKILFTSNMEGTLGDDTSEPGTARQDVFLASIADASPSPTSLTAVVTVADKQYDGTTDATIATRSLTGVVVGDHVTLTGGTAVFSDSAIERSKTVTVTELALSGADALSYVLVSDSVTVTADITRQTILSSADDPKRWVLREISVKPRAEERA